MRFAVRLILVTAWLATHAAALLLGMFIGYKQAAADVGWQLGDANRTIIELRQRLLENE